MTRLAWIGLGLLAALALTGAICLERNAATHLHQEREVLLAAKQEADQLAEENQRLAQSRDQVQNLDALRAANRDLPRLRNEVRQLREQQKEMEKLRAENQRLVAEIKSGAAPRRRLAEKEGYVAKETWANTGFTTPEAAVQSLFWAMREANPQQMAECLQPKERERFLKDLGQASEADRRRMTAESSPMARVKGYRIAEKTIQSEDSVVLSIQFVTDGEVTKMPLRKFGQEWKIANF